MNSAISSQIYLPGIPNSMATPPNPFLMFPGPPLLPPGCRHYRNMEGIFATSPAQAQAQNFPLSFYPEAPTPAIESNSKTASPTSASEPPTSEPPTTEPPTSEPPTSEVVTNYLQPSLVRPIPMKCNAIPSMTTAVSTPPLGFSASKRMHKVEIEQSLSLSLTSMVPYPTPSPTPISEPWHWLSPMPASSPHQMIPSPSSSLSSYESPSPVTPGVHMAHVLPQERHHKQLTERQNPKQSLSQTPMVPNPTPTPTPISEPWHWLTPMPASSPHQMISSPSSSLSSYESPSPVTPGVPMAHVLPKKRHRQQLTQRHHSQQLLSLTSIVAYATPTPTPISEPWHWLSPMSAFSPHQMVPSTSWSLSSYESPSPVTPDMHMAHVLPQERHHKQLTERQNPQQSLSQTPMVPNPTPTPTPISDPWHWLSPMPASSPHQMISSPSSSLSSYESPSAVTPGVSMAHVLPKKRHRQQLSQRQHAQQSLSQTPMVPYPTPTPTPISEPCHWPSPMPASFPHQMIPSPSSSLSSYESPSPVTPGVNMAQERHHQQLTPPQPSRLIYPRMAVGFQRFDYVASLGHNFDMRNPNSLPKSFHETVMDTGGKRDDGTSQMKKCYSCNYCGKNFQRPTSLTRHFRIHNLVQPNKCSYCERSYTTCSGLQRHVRNCHSEKANKPNENTGLSALPRCGPGGNAGGHLHIANDVTGNVDSVEKNNGNCLVVDLSINELTKEGPSLATGLDTIEVSNSAGLEERNSCMYCGKIYQRDAFLNLRKHIIKQPYICRYCEQPYKCRYCEQPFTTYGNMQRHVRSYHNTDANDQNGNIGMGAQAVGGAADNAIPYDATGDANSVEMYNGSNRVIDMSINKLNMERPSIVTIELSP